MGISKGKNKVELTINTSNKILKNIVEQAIVVPTINAFDK